MVTTYRGGTMAAPWQHHGSTMTAPWQHHGGTMATPLRHHGSAMAAPWQHHGGTMAAPWRHHGGTMAAPAQEPTPASVSKKGISHCLTRWCKLCEKGSSLGRGKWMGRGKCTSFFCGFCCKPYCCPSGRVSRDCFLFHFHEAGGGS